MDIAVSVNGIETNPFGAYPNDPQLGSGSIALIDDSAGLVLNFEVSNRRVMTLRKLFVVTTLDGETGSVQPIVDPALTDLSIEPGSWDRFEIRYYPGVDARMEPRPDRAE